MRPRGGEDLRSFVVVNPRSAAGATARRWKAIAREIGGAVGSFEHGITEGPGHATELTRAALAAGFEQIVAVGGDGTLNEVACGFFDGRRSVMPDAVLGVVPHGTGCDFIRTLGGQRTVREACARLAGRRARAVDVGIARFVDHEGRPRERVFVNVTSFGCGGAVAAAMSRTSKRLGGRLGFMLTTAATILRYRDQEVTVSLDEGPAQALTLTSLAVCNGQYFGGGMRVAPAAAVDDGRFAVTVWSGVTLRDFVMRRRSLYDGTHVTDPKTRVLQATKVVAAARERVLLEVDGEAVGALPATIEILPRALKVKV